MYWFDENDGPHAGAESASSVSQLEECEQESTNWSQKTFHLKLQICKCRSTVKFTPKKLYDIGPIFDIYFLGCSYDSTLIAVLKVNMNKKLR